MHVFIDKQFSGFPHHAVLDKGQMRWAEDEPSNGYAFGRPESTRALEPLFRLFSIEEPVLVPAEVKKSFEECGYHGEVPWSFVIPSMTFKSFFLDFVESVEGGLSVLTDSEYPSFFCETNELFSHLKSSSMSVERCKALLEENDSHSLKSLLAMTTGERLPVPAYDRVSTKTGRLTIKSGPQILTLKKEHRSIFKPSQSGNRLYEVDFSSLEPRVALCIAGKNIAADVYTSFSQDMKLEVTRDVAKLAVLCSLYGAGKHRLETVLRKDNSPVKAPALLKAVKQYFAIDALSKSLVKEARTGTIHNMFGRPIEVDDARNTVLINNFLQSSATDIAILGFLDLVKKVGTHISPLFIIHDALVFEADPKNLAPITEYVNKGFDLNGVGNFPLKITEFSSHE